LLKVLVLWQPLESQDLVVDGCPLGLPFAKTPLWQVAHVPGITPVWLIVADANVVVERWQRSQDTPPANVVATGMWLADMPFAVVPLWQVLQVPGATPVWLKVAGIQAVVL